MANTRKAGRNLRAPKKKTVYERKTSGMVFKHKEVHKGNGMWEQIPGSLCVVTDPEEIKKFFGENRGCS